MGRGLVRCADVAEYRRYSTASDFIARAAVMLSFSYAKRRLRANFFWQERCCNRDSSGRLVTGQFEPTSRGGSTLRVETMKTHGLRVC